MSLETIETYRLEANTQISNLPTDTTAELAWKVEEAPIDWDVYWRVNAWWVIIGSISGLQAKSPETTTKELVATADSLLNCSPFIR